jgi:hypothetical protein
MKASTLKACCTGKKLGVLASEFVISGDGLGVVKVICCDCDADAIECSVSSAVISSARLNIFTIQAIPKSERFN